jgi:dTDP-glucose pyrophosphorylase
MNNFLIRSNCTIKDAMKSITLNMKQSVVIVNAEMILIGVATDGDIRRGILKGISIEESIDQVLNTLPKTISSDIDKSDWHKYEAEYINIYPVVDKKRQLIDLHFKEVCKSLPKKVAVIMAGGLGTRLRPITENIPKALVCVQGEPILLKIINQLKAHDFNKIILTVNHKADMIRDYFKDGSHLGVEIEYIYETKKMGTAGSLSLIETAKYTPSNFLVMNCDIVTDIDFTALFEFHESQKSLATMCINQFDFKMTYGVVETCETKITQIKEKPVYKFNVNSGIYLLNKSVFKNIPKDEFYDMPQLFDKLILDNMEVHAFPIHEKWVDIGQISDLEKVNSDKK